jgi:hypothetical protein
MQLELLFGVGKILSADTQFGFWSLAVAVRINVPPGTGLSANEVRFTSLPGRYRRREYTF